MGIPDHLTCLLRDLCADQEVTVRPGHGRTDWFHIGKRVPYWEILGWQRLRAGREGRQRKMRWLDGITDLIDMSLTKLQEIVKDTGAWHAAIYVVTKNWT